MKLIIQIPCFNEADTLAFAFRDMPREIDGIDVIEYQIIDDGSTDKTIEKAKALGVHHIVRVKGRNRRWLGRAFRMGVDHALSEGADIVVNTDGDNQYPSSKIPELVRPILEEKVDIVVGDRDPSRVSEFSPLKRSLQMLGNKVFSFLVKEDVRDAVSGFRAYSRDALLKLNVVTNYTYTVDSLMQAYQKGIDVAWIDITTNNKTRDSRLIRSLSDKVRKSGSTILRLSTVYRPYKTFLALSAVFLIPGMLALARFMFIYFFLPERASGHLQSVVIGGVCLVVGVQMMVLGIIGDLLAVNRTLIEDLLFRTKKLELKQAEENRVSKNRPQAVRQEKAANF